MIIMVAQLDSEKYVNNCSYPMRFWWLRILDVDGSMQCFFYFTHYVDQKVNLVQFVQRPYWGKKTKKVATFWEKTLTCHHF
jgi:hypothetical protein